MNVLVLGARVVGEALATDIVIAFLRARFNGGGRYLERVNKVLAMEAAMQSKVSGAS
jgi:ribose 5-phosphate isomerase B